MRMAAYKLRHTPSFTTPRLPHCPVCLRTVCVNSFARQVNWNRLLRAKRQAPVTPALSCSFESTMAESRLTMLSEYFLTALFTG